MTKLKRRTFLAAAIAASTLPLYGLPGRAQNSTGTLTVGLSAYPSNFDPFLDVGAAAAFIQQAVHRGLLGYSAAGEMRGELAESWRSVDDTTWEFVLRDATFSNGDPVTPEDVKWTLEHIGADGSTAVMKPQIDQITEIKIVDERTVHLITDGPVAVLPDWFANYYLPILPSTTTDPAAAPGAGPFVISGQQRGEFIEVTARDDFWRNDLPKLEAIRFIIYSDENLRVAALQAGDVDLIDFVPWQSMAAIDDEPNLEVDEQAGLFMYVMFNYDFEPFKNPLVRQAIAQAIRREDVIEAAFYGRGDVLDEFPVVPGTRYENSDYADVWAYDPEKSRALLTEAGYPDGFTCRMLSTSQYSMHQDTALVVQQYLQEIGIELEMILPDWATRGQLGNEGQYDLAVQGTGWGSTDPSAWAKLLDGSSGNSVVRSYDMNYPELNEMFKQGAAELDPDRRLEIYNEIQQFVVAETPFVPLLWRVQGYGLKSSVEGFTNMPGPLTQYSGYTFETTSIE